MKSDKVLESCVTVLKTPLLDMEIVDENGVNIPFDVIDSRAETHFIYVNNNADRVREVTDYDERMIRVRTSDLEIGRRPEPGWQYFVKSSKPLEWRNSDEQLFTYGYTEETRTFAVSFPDPNEEYKFTRNHGTDDKMRWFDFNCDAESGEMPVSFRLIDREREYIYIAAAWIWNICDHMRDYESCAEVATWII